MFICLCFTPLFFKAKKRLQLFPCSTAHKHSCQSLTMVVFNRGHVPLIPYKWCYRIKWLIYSGTTGAVLVYWECVQNGHRSAKIVGSLWASPWVYFWYHGQHITLSLRQFIGRAPKSVDFSAKILSWLALCLITLWCLQLVPIYMASVWYTW